LVVDDTHYRPWVLTDDISGFTGSPVTWFELEGPGALRYHVSADSGRALTTAVGNMYGRVPDKRRVLALPPEEQYLVASGRTYFGGLTFDELHRLQFDIETTGLDATHDRVFLIAVRLPDGTTRVLESTTVDDDSERGLLRALEVLVREADPDVIENHNLHGFDLPFLEQRARLLGVTLQLGRIPGMGLRRRAARRGIRDEHGSDRRIRLLAPGRELIDTLDATRAYDFAVRELPGYGLKAVAKHLGIAGPDRELIRGDEVFSVYRRDPARVRRYAEADVEEAAGIARLLGGATFALAKMVPRRYERLADAGPATGMLDPLLVRAYIRSGTALPAHQDSDGTVHTGAALHLFATGVAQRIVKADVASLYPSLMRAFRIGPSRDHLGVLLTIVDQLVQRRLEAKAAARAADPGSAERHSHEAMSAAIKLVVNSAYGYLAAGGGLTRFADVRAANEVTRRGRDTLQLICDALRLRGVQLIEADTDGVYFGVPAEWSEADERRVVDEVGALLPPLVHLEFEGRYAAMLSHEPKNYALLTYDGRLLLRGVAFRSSRTEPYAAAFLQRAIGRLLSDDVPAVRQAYVDAVNALRRRAVPTWEVASRVRVTKSPEEYLSVREERRELVYEAMLTAGRSHWRQGERVHVYRTFRGSGALVPDRDAESLSDAERQWVDARDYDVDHYVRLLTEIYAGRMACAFTAADFAVVFASADQPSLFAEDVAAIRSILQPVS
jgi:DNA polymerase elongation subunit (family B)